MENLKWIAIQLQTLSPTYDVIISVNSNDRNPTSTEYKEFIKYIEEEYLIQNYAQLKYEIDGYNPILIKIGDKKVCTWEIHENIKMDKDNYSFDDLVALNGGYNTDQEEQKEFQDVLTDRNKKIIEKGSEWLKNVIKGENRFDRLEND